MKKGEFLFVYGTLRLGQSADLSRTGKALYVQPHKIGGDLYALGWFPGVKFNDHNEVLGDLFLIEDESITPQLDRYEGHPSLFERQIVDEFDGKPVWAYEYKGDVTSARQIESGDWNIGER